MALELTFLGQSGFLCSDGVHAVAIDPFLTNNPLARHTPDQIACKTILLTHGHEDHVGDTVAIAKNNGATVIGCHEVSVWAGEQGLETIGGNPGGRIKTDWGWVAFTQAFHSSSHSGRQMGIACGLVFNLGGATVYHCGDTGLFSDMKLIGEIYGPDIALIPIGDQYTMGPELATMAAEWIGARVAIPIHYKTFPFMVQDASAFRPQGVEVKLLEPGESWSYG